MPLPPTAALTLSLSGRFARQGRDAAEGVRMWAESTGATLRLVDDHGSRDVAAHTYACWVHDPAVDLVLGPYSGGLVRSIAPVAREAGRVVWNHGASGDDLQRPGVVPLLAPASTYFHGVVDAALAEGADRVALVRGRGPFARSVADGARSYAGRRGCRVLVTDPEGLTAEATAGAAVLVVGNFEHDVAVAARLRREDHHPALVGAVAAGIPAFADELGAEEAEGVVGPVQWWPTDREPEVGPSGAVFAREFRGRTGREPSYVAAQAAAGGHLAEAAWRQGRGEADLVGWQTSTLLGDFALGGQWRQVGHTMTAVRWHGGRMEPVDA